MYRDEKKTYTVPYKKNLARLLHQNKQVIFLTRNTVMDLSVFNLLMSTNPNTAAAENIFSDAVQSGVPAAGASKGQDALRTGEAFLQVLEQARTGKTEKNADALYNTISARADAASSLKNLKSASVSRENVKVVKLHIKRTRASETLRKADERKAVSAPEAAQDGKKIPTQDNIAPVQSVSSLRPERNETQDAGQDVGFETFSLPVQDAVPQKKIALPEEEITAADILIRSAIQNIRTPAPQTAPENVPEEKERAQAVFAGVLPEIRQESGIEPRTVSGNQTITPVVEKQAAPRNVAPAPVENTSVPAAEEKISIPEERPDFVFAKKEQPEKRVFAIGTPVAERTETFAGVAPEAVPDTGHESVRSAKTMPQTVTAGGKEATPDIPDEQTDVAEFDGKTFSVQARRQAEELAKALPATEHIAVRVEIEAPAVKAFAVSQNVSSRPSGVKKAGNDAEKEDAALPETESAVALERKKELSLQSAERGKTDISTDRNAPETNDFSEGLAALPVQTEEQPETVVRSQGQTAEIAGTTNVSTPAAAVLHTGREFNGKAVSGSVPVRTPVPLNELADQIKVNIKKALKDGLDKIDIVLKPKELGTIKIHLEIGKDGSMKVVLNTARTETLDLLKADLSALKQALTDSGFDMNDRSFAFNYRGERYNDEHRRQDGRQNAFSAEETEDDLSADIIQTAGSLSFSGRYALNIRV